MSGGGGLGGVLPGDRPTAVAVTQGAVCADLPLAWGGGGGGGARVTAEACQGDGPSDEAHANSLL